MNQFKIMTYNIRHGSGMDDRWDISRTVDTVRRCAPDILCLQEVDRFTGRSFGADEPAMMAAMLDPLRYWEFVKSIDFGGGEYGNAVLSREKPLSVRRFALPGVNEARSLIACEFARYTVCTMHCSLHEEARMESVGTVASLAASADKPLFITGDWNAKPDSPFLAAVREHFTLLSDPSVLTCHAAVPDMCIDYVAVDTAHASSVEVLSAEVVAEPLASDHRPVLVSLSLK